VTKPAMNICTNNPSQLLPLKTSLNP